MFLINKYKRIFKLLKTIRIERQLTQSRHLSDKDSKDLRLNSRIPLNEKMSQILENREFVDLSVESFSEIITNNEIKEKISEILSEYEFEKYCSDEVPITLTIDNMNDLLMCKTLIDRKCTINYFYNKEVLKVSNKLTKKQLSEDYWRQKNEFYSQRSDDNIPKSGVFDGNENIIYGLWHNTLFAKFRRNAISRIYSNRLRTAALFGQKLIIDLDFDQYMRLFECRSLAQQIQHTISYNKYKTIEPFDIQFTNCKPNMTTMKELPRYVLNLNSPQFMSEFHTKSYLDLYPKHKLVYITKDAPNVLKKYSHEDIYIVSGLVSKSCSHRPLSYIKAQKEGIRCLRLPLDEYILWERGAHTSLCLNHVVAILHDIKMSGNWKQSLIHNIPQRKLKKVEDIQYEDLLREHKLKKRIRLENKQRTKIHVKK